MKLFRLPIYLNARRVLLRSHGSHISIAGRTQGTSLILWGLGSLALWRTVLDLGYCMEQPVKNELRPRTLRFGVFEVDPCTQELRKQGVRVRLPAQSIQILLMLLETPGQLVNREELRNKLWPQDTFVDFDHGVNAAVNRLREALGDSAENPKFIETLPRRGYRFTAAIEGGGENSAVAQPIPSELNKAAVESAPRIGKRWRVWAIAAGIICAAVVFGIWFVLPPAQPRIVGSRQITHDGKGKCCVFTDGSRLYIPEKDNDGMFRIKYVPVTGGDPVTIPTPSLYIGDGAIMTDISSDHDRLLVRTRSVSSCTFWSVPLTGSSPRPLAKLSKCSWGQWSPDGQTLA
jgi:DNA-binding winged helix-turn-helix (wHTH) protein